jgi:hypothetical protein
MTQYHEVSDGIYGADRMNNNLALIGVNNKIV